MDDLDFALAALRHAETATEELRTRLERAEQRLQLIENSIGWRAILRYRRWLRSAIWSVPGLARAYEAIAGAALRALSGAGSPEASSLSLSLGSIIEETLTSSDVTLCCDWPRADHSARVAGSLPVMGWAVARTGVEAVRITVDSKHAVEVETGVERRDVGIALPEYPDARLSGFRAAVNVTELSAGPHFLVIEAVARSGEVSKAVRKFRADKRDAYQIWMAECERKPPSAKAPQAFAYRPLISVVTAVYNTPFDCLGRCVESLSEQTYGRWELLLVDDGSSDPSLAAELKRLAETDRRIQLLATGTNRGAAAALNLGIASAAGDYIGFLDHDDELAPFALEEVAAALNNDVRPDVLYSDEDKITAEGARYDPFFKPEFSPDLLRSFNYVCHFLVARTALLREAGGLRASFDGALDHDLVLRLSERTTKIRRVPRVLYHWRAIPGSTALDAAAKPHAGESARRAIEQHLERSGLEGEVEEIETLRFRVRYRLPEEPEILIVMPTGGNMPRLSEALESVLADSRYGNFRIVVADNSTGSEVHTYLRRFERDSRVLELDFRKEPFNFSRLCNEAAKATRSPLLLFLNDDVTVTAPDWLTAMAELAMQREIGVVGAKLLYPDGRIQHAGVTLGIFGLAGHAFRGQPAENRHYFGFADNIRNCTAVTGACLMTRREAFERLGGFDTDLAVEFQDVDYCLRAHSQGLRVTYTPYAELRHFESASRGPRQIALDPREAALVRQRWSALIADDPFYSPNLTRRDETFAPRIDG